MNTLKDYVDFRLTHSDKFTEAEGYPLKLSDCKKYKPMRELKMYGNSYQGGTPTPDNPIEVQSVGDFVADREDENYGKYKIPLVTRGVNLFSMKKMNATVKTVNGITFTPLDDERVHIKGVASDQNTNIGFTYLTKLKGNMSIKRGVYKAKPNKYTRNGLNVMFGVNNGTSGKNINTFNNSDTIEFDNGYVGNLYLGISGNGLTREWDDVIELQLMKGEEDLPYEPYVEPITTNIFLDEPLCKLGDFTDYIDFKNNVIVKNTCVHTITSAGIRNKSDWHLTRGWNAYEYVKLPYTVYKEMYGIYDLCTHFKKPSSYTTEGIGNFSFSISSASNNILYLITTEASDEKVEEFKELLDRTGADKPIKLYCRLAETRREPMPLEIPKLAGKTIIIEVETSLAPSGAYGKYIKR